MFYFMFYFMKDVCVLNKFSFGVIGHTDFNEFAF